MRARDRYAALKKHAAILIAIVVAGVLWLAVVAWLGFG
jgi:hypothetical protein